MYLARTLEEGVRRLSRSFPVVLLTGPRQVGKTTLLARLGEAEDPPRQVISLDAAGPQTLAQEDPELFLQRYPPPVTIDEVQHAPQLLAALKPRVDRSGRMGDYWLTGSQHFGLMRSVSETLAGRVAVLELMGLSQAEAHQWPSVRDPFRPDRVEDAPAGPRRENELLPLFERIVRGSMPRLVHDDAPPWENFWGSYVQTYLERDVRALTDVRDLATFRRFLRLAAARTGQLLNYASLARDTGVAVSTAREWLHLLEATLQVVLLRPYFRNLSKRQIKTPKLYFIDTGLACYLTGWRSAETAASGAMAGALLETYVIAELYKSYRHRAREAPLWYFRNKEGREVDALIDEDGLLYPLEVKLTASPSRRDLSGFGVLARTGARLGKGAVLCLVPEQHPLTAEVDAIPAGSIW